MHCTHTERCTGTCTHAHCTHRTFHDAHTTHTATPPHLPTNLINITSPTNPTNPMPINPINPINKPHQPHALGNMMEACSSSDDDSMSSDGAAGFGPPIARIAIAGAGFSGAILARQLSMEPNVEVG